MSRTKKEAIIKLAREAYEQDSLVLFIGAGMSQGSGLPSWAELFRPLAEEADLDLSEKPNSEELTKIAQLYSQRIGKPKLVERLLRVLGDPKVKPNIQHRLIAASTVKSIYTTNYDRLIENAYLDADKQIMPVSRAENFIQGMPHVVKMCGDLYDSETIVSTFEDYQYFEKEKTSLITFLRSDFARNTVLFIGYSFNDPFLQKICLEAIKESGNRCQIIVVTLEWSATEIELWEGFNVKCINIEPNLSKSGLEQFNFPVETVLRKVFNIHLLDNPLDDSATKESATVTHDSATEPIINDVFSTPNKANLDSNLQGGTKVLSTSRINQIDDKEPLAGYDAYKQKSFEAARSRLNKGKLSVAREGFTQLLEFPDVDEVFRQRLHFNLALTWYYADIKDKAAEEIKRGLQFKGPPKREAIFRAILALIEKRYTDVPGILSAYRSTDNDAVRLIADAVKLKSGCQNAIELLEEFEEPDNATKAHLANCYAEINQFDNAERILRATVAENNDAYYKFNLGSIILISILERREELLLASFTLKREDRLRLKEAMSLLQGAESDIARNECNSLRIGLWLNLSACASAIQKYEEALRAVECGLHVDPTNETLLNNKMAIFGNQEKFAEAGLVAERLFEKLKTEDALARWAECEFNASNTIRVEQVLQEWKNLYEHPNADYYKIKAMQCWRSKHVDDAFRIIETGLKLYPKSVHLLIEKGKLEAMESKESAESTLKEAIKISTGHEKYLAKQRLGLYYFEKKEWKLAQSFLFRPDEGDDPFNCLSIEEYLICLYNNHQLSDCHKLLVELRREGMDFSARLCDLAAFLYLQLNDLGEALRFGRDALHKESTVKRNLLMVELHLRLGQTDLAMQEAESAIQQYSGSWEAFIFASRTATLRGNYLEAVRYGIKAVELNAGELATHQALFFASVSPGVDSKLSEAEKEKVRDSLQFLVNHEGSGVQQVEFDKNFSQLKAMLRDHSQHIEDYRRIYTEKLVPLSLLANCNGRSYHAFWMSCIVGEFCSFRMAIGSKEEQEREEKWATESSAIILDASSLFTLEMLDCLDLIHSVYDKVLVPWKVLEVLQAELNLDFHHKANGIISYHKGSYNWQEITSESYKYKKEQFKNILEFLQDESVTKTGVQPEDLSNAKFTEMVAAIGIDFSHAVLHAKSTGTLYYCDDYAIREVARAGEGVNGICTQAFLRAAMKKGVLSVEEYNRHVVKLISSNYGFISENEGVLWYHFSQCDYKVDDLLVKMMERVNLKGVEKEGAYRILGNFIGHVWFDLGKCGTGREQVAKIVGDIFSKVDDNQFFNYSFHFVLGIMQQIKYFPVIIWGCVAAITSSVEMSWFKSKYLVIAFYEALRITISRAYQQKGFQSALLFSGYEEALENYPLAEWAIVSNKPRPSNEEFLENQSKLEQGTTEKPRKRRKKKR